MPILPLAAVTLTVILDGRPLRSYIPATIDHGRATGPVEPFITRLADRIDPEKPYLIITRNDRSVRVLVRSQTEVRFTRVPIAAIARSLGLEVSYDARERVLYVRTTRAALRTPEPFQPNAPQPTPTVVFTPVPTSTPRPVWTGSPLPRRTPLPAGSL